MLPLEGSGKGPSCLCQPLVPDEAPKATASSLLPLPVSTAHLLSVCLPFFHLKPLFCEHLSLDLGPTHNPGLSSPVNALNLNTSAKTSFPNKVTLRDFRDAWGHSHTVGISSVKSLSRVQLFVTP